MRNITVFFIANFFTLNAICQNIGKAKTDSLQSVLTNTNDDTQKVKLFLEISNSSPYWDTAISINAAKKAFTLSEKLDWKNGEMLSLIRIGNIYDQKFKNYTNALSYYYKCAAIAKKSQDKIKEANVYNFIGLAYKHENKYDSALEYFGESLELNNNPEMQNSTLANSGLIYNSLGDYPHALECYEHALKITEALLSTGNKNDKDSLSLAGLLLTIGDIYVSMYQYDKALDNYNTALKIAETIKEKVLIIWILTDLGKVYKIQKNYQESIECFEKSLELSNSYKNGIDKAIILNELSNVYLEKGDIAKALNYAKQSLTILAGQNDMQQLPKTYTTLGKIYTQKKNYKDAVAYLTKAISICKTTGALADERDAWDALSDTYQQMGEPAKTLDAYKHFIALRDSVYNVDKAKELVRIDLQSGFSRKQLADSFKQEETKKVFMLRYQKQRAYTYGGFGGLVLVLLLSFFIYRNYNQQKEANKTISKANARIQKEKLVSETLLLNILPEGVAQELKTVGKVQAKLYDEVTVLFTDFVNFTKAGERLSPQQLVAELDTCFQAFDEIISKYNIEKIKTVGDAYLAVSGLPHANANHAADVVSAAIEMRDFMAERSKQLGEMTFEMRIGINSGSVVAGIVGLKKFAYDIWGDTVNTAARMEQYGEPGKINISESTYRLLKGEFNCQYRGKIEAKNKGTIDMYFVV